jgi:hypothetical protein
MRLACLVASALLIATGCGVPNVSFTDAGKDATRDSPGPDAPADSGGDAADAETDAEGDANGDAADSGDAGTDAPEYCKGDAGPPVGYGCCLGSPGEVCGGQGNPCSASNCAKCGSGCTWPSRCCTGVCTPPDAGGC